MADITLTQAEADVLIAMEKHRANDEPHEFPMHGQSLVLPLHSADRREQFLLDIKRGSIDLMKATYQNRARQVVTLLRLDYGGPPHRNPDDQEIPCPHLHVYKEGYGDKWAVSVPTSHFRQPGDLWVLLEDFMQFCNISTPPLIEKGLFS